MNTKQQKSKEYAEANYKTEIWQKEAVKCYEAGWDEALKSQFRKCVNDKPIKGDEPKEGENVILLCQMIGGSNDGFVFPKVNTYKNGDWESKMLMRYNVIAWMPIPSFDEILNANKDVLKRLKGE